MKNKLIILLLAASLLVPISAAKAQTTEELLEQYQQTLMALINLLMEQVSQLQTQLAALQLEQTRQSATIEAFGALSNPIIEAPVQQNKGYFGLQEQVFRKNSNDEWAWQGVDTIDYYGSLEMKFGYRCLKYNRKGGVFLEEFPNCDNPNFVLEPTEGIPLLVRLHISSWEKPIEVQNITTGENGLFSISFSVLSESEKNKVYSVNIYNEEGKGISSFAIRVK